MIVRGIQLEAGRSTLMIMKARWVDREQPQPCMIVRGIRLGIGRIPLTITGNQPSAVTASNQRSAVTASELLTVRRWEQAGVCQMSRHGEYPGSTGYGEYPGSTGQDKMRNSPQSV
jgi:hypothetical protein